MQEPGLAATAIGIAVLALFVCGGHALLDMLVPDPCAYHNGKAESGWLLDLIFPMTSSSGYHPEPGLVFYATALCCGAGVGLMAYRRFDRHGAARN